MPIRGWQMLVIIIVLGILGLVAFMGGMLFTGTAHLCGPEETEFLGLKVEKLGVHVNHEFIPIESAEYYIVKPAPFWAAIPIAIFYVALAYVAAAVLIIGLILRAAIWTVTPKGPGGLYWGLYRLTLHNYVRSWWDAAGIILARIVSFFTLLKYNFGTRAIGFWLKLALFHWMIWLVLMFHGNSLALGAVISLTEGLIKLPIQVPVFYTHVPHDLKLLMGGAAGLVALACGIGLIGRRFWIPARFKVRICPSIDDWFAISWLCLIIFFGLTAKLLTTMPPYTEASLYEPLGVPEKIAHGVIHEFGSIMYYLVGCWFAGLISGKINLAINAIYSLFYYGASVGPAFILMAVHIMLVQIFMIYFPWAKMIHPLSFPFNPALYGKFEKPEPAIRKLEEIVPA